MSKTFEAAVTWARTQGTVPAPETGHAVRAVIDEALAAKEGYSVGQFLASAAGEKLAVVLTVDYLRREAAAGRREDFEKYLAAVPDVEPPEDDRLD